MKPNDPGAGWFSRLKSRARSLDNDSALYNALAWGYGAVTGNRAVRRDARMRWRKDSRFGEAELPMATGCPQVLVDAVLDRWAPQSVLDVGCGVGSTLEYLVERGLDGVGIEGSTAAVDRSPVRHLITVANLNYAVDLNRQFDLVWSYEVAEHIHPKFVEAFLRTLTSHGDHVVISAARPGQSGAGHFNEQPPEYWIERFEARGFGYDAAFSAHLQRLPENHAENMMAFAR